MSAISVSDGSDGWDGSGSAIRLAAIRSDAAIVLAMLSVGHRLRMAADDEARGWVERLMPGSIEAAGGWRPELYAGASGPFPNHFAEIALLDDPLDDQEVE